MRVGYFTWAYILKNHAVMMLDTVSRLEKGTVICILACLFCYVLSIVLSIVLSLVLLLHGN